MKDLDKDVREDVERYIEAVCEELILKEGKNLTSLRKTGINPGS